MSVDNRHQSGWLSFLPRYIQYENVQVSGKSSLVFQAADSVRLAEAGFLNSNLIRRCCIGINSVGPNQLTISALGRS